MDTTERQQQIRAMGERISALDEKVKALDDSFREMLAGIPNLPHESVPVGRSSDDNVEVRRWGQPRQFDFEPKAHWDLGPELKILDLERAAKITGARFAVYWGMGAKLERALMSFMLDVHTREHGYTEVFPPCMINSASLVWNRPASQVQGRLVQGGRSRPVAVADRRGSGDQPVPRRNPGRRSAAHPLCAYTPCFRSEAGSYGRDVRGIIRVHQFHKVEMVKFALPEQSYDELEKMTANAEDILKRLGLPFRTVVLSTGDTGRGSAKTYDVEVWLPGQNDYKEISSCSNCEAYQARRASIRAKSGKGKAEYVHTLNGSGLPIGRTWVAIIENYQQADGSIVVPEALRPYLGVDRIEAESQKFH